MPISYALVATLTIIAAGQTKVLSLGQVPVPAQFDEEMSIASELNLLPEFKANVLDENGEIDGQVQAGADNFWIPIPEVKVPIPASVQLVLKLAQGLNGQAPEVSLDLKLEQVGTAAPAVAVVAHADGSVS